MVIPPTFAFVFIDKILSLMTNENIKEAYLFEPTSQNMVPNNKALIMVNIILIALYGGLLQYTRFCFHKHLTNCDHVFCENNVSNFNGCEPAGGCAYCLIEPSTPLR